MTHASVESHEVDRRDGRKSRWDEAIDRHLPILTTDQSGGNLAAVDA